MRVNSESLTSRGERARTPCRELIGIHRGNRHGSDVTCSARGARSSRCAIIDVAAGDVKRASSGCRRWTGDLSPSPPHLPPLCHTWKRRRRRRRRHPTRMSRTPSPSPPSRTAAVTATGLAAWDPGGLGNQLVKFNYRVRGGGSCLETCERGWSREGEGEEERGRLASSTGW